MNRDYQVMVVELKDRRKQAPKVQEIFTRYGECILARHGVHDPDENTGIITLNVRADEEYLDRFCKELSSLPGVHANRMRVR